MKVRAIDVRGTETVSEPNNDGIIQSRLPVGGGKPGREFRENGRGCPVQNSGRKRKIRSIIYEGGDGEGGDVKKRSGGVLYFKMRNIQPCQDRNI